MGYLLSFTAWLVNYSLEQMISYGSQKLYHYFTKKYVKALTQE